MRFAVPGGQWVEGRVSVPALAAGYRMRIDPPGTGGQIMLQSLSFEAPARCSDFDFTTFLRCQPMDCRPTIFPSWPYSIDGLNVAISGADPYARACAQLSDEYPALAESALEVHPGGHLPGVLLPKPGNRRELETFQRAWRQWHEARVPVPALDKGYYLRLDPPGQGGTCLLGRMWFEERALLPAPAWPQPKAPVMGSGALEIASGQLRLTHNAGNWGEFEPQSWLGIPHGSRP